MKSDLDFDKVQQTVPKSGFIHIANLSSEYLHLRLESSSDQIQIDKEDLSIPPYYRSRIKCTFTPDTSEYGKVCIPVSIIDSDNGNKDAFVISAIVIDNFTKCTTEDFQDGPCPVFSKQYYSFKAPPSVDSYKTEIKFVNKSGKSLNIRSVFSDNDLIDVRAENCVEGYAGSTIGLSFNTKDSIENNISGFIYILTDSPSRPLLQIGVVCEISKTYYDPFNKM